VFKKGDRCLIHFCQMPDSSDNWGTCWPESEPPEVSQETLVRGIQPHFLRNVALAAGWGACTVPVNTAQTGTYYTNI